MAANARDTTNLKKALTEMQMLNNKNLATIYEKGDQNLAQMQQMEDLSAIIRSKDNEIADLNTKIDDLTDQNRQLHLTAQQAREEAAALNANKGMDMLMNSSMKDKMMDDPRFAELMKGK